MKSTIKFFLIGALFVSNAFADGDMGSGGVMDGDMGSGRIICNPTVSICPATNQPVGANGQPDAQNSDSEDSDESILTIVEEYLGELFG